MALRIQTADATLAERSTRRPSTGATKPRSEALHVGQSDGASRPSSSDSTHVGSRPSSSASAASVPSDAIYNTQFTTAGRKFLSKVKKNRAMQVDRRTKGFERGLESGTMIMDAITKKHFRVMIVDPDLQHREDLADALEQHFEIFVAATNDRAFALLAMFKVDLILLRLTLGNDQSLATSTSLEFLRELKKRYYYIPVSLLLRNAQQQDKLLAQALALGGCGFFENDVDVDAVIERLRKLLHSLVLANVELVKCRGKALGNRDDDDERAMRAEAAQALVKRGNTAIGARRTGSTKPATIEYDREKMLLELSLNQRKQCLERRKQLTQTLATSHSVLGIELGETVADHEPITPSSLATLRSPSLMHCESTKSLMTPLPSTPSLVALRANSIMKKIPPLPSQHEISKRIYTKPHEIQVKIHQHLYESYHTDKHEAVPQDPLLRPCVAIDPETVSRSATNLLVGKAYRLYLEKRYEEAHQLCDRAIRVQDNNVVKLAYLLRGVLFDLSGHHARAEAEFLTCLKLDSQLHAAHFNLCVCRLKMGKDQLALHDVTTALHMDPSNPDYLMNRALIYRRLGEFGLAQNEYSKIAALEHSGKGMPGPMSPMAPRSPTHAETKVVEDGLFDHLFGKPMPDKLALMCVPSDRDTDQLDLVVARLQSVLFFQDFPREVLLDVAHHLEYEVVACGKAFTLGEEHPHNFYVLLSGRLSVRRKLGDLASSVTTHHMDPGAPFGCSGHVINSHSKLMADESSEVGILWPDAYEATIHNYCTEKNNEVFVFLQQHKAFKLFSTSELGHIIGISERRRYRKGELLLEQNQTPQYLVIVRKGTCLMYQDFESPPLSTNREEANAALKRSAEGDKHEVLPYHHLLATGDWPLGFRVQNNLKKKRKHVRGRRNALMDRHPAPSAADLLLHAARSGVAVDADETETETMKYQTPVVLNNDKPRRTLGPGAIFGESTLLEQQHTRAKCSVLTDSVVEVLLLDHLRLQEMELSRDIVDEIMKYSPEYIDEEQALKKQIEAEAWNEYKNLRMLELSKKRWPQAKTHLRVLSNGNSIMLDSRPSTAPGGSNNAPEK